MKLGEWATGARCKYCANLLQKQLIPAGDVFQRTKFVRVCERCDRIKRR